MSNTPLPFHQSCFGVHADIVSSVRQGQFNSRHSNFNARFEAARATLAASRSAAAQAPGAAAPSASAPATSSSSAMPTPLHLKQTPVSSADYQAMTSKASRTGRAGKGLPSSAMYVDTSKQMGAPVVPVSMDFQAIADASVGGGGLSRPYGRFCATRKGDGNAMWERLPPRPRGALQSPGHSDRTNAVSPSAQGPPSPTQSPQHDSCARSRPHVRGNSPAIMTFKQEQLKWIDKTLKQDGTNISNPSHKEQQSSLRRPELYHNLPGSTSGVNSALRQWPPNDCPASSSCKPPAATFLGGVPKIPGFLRVDCGHSASRAHLKSGLLSAGQPQELDSLDYGMNADGYAPDGQGGHAYAMSPTGPSPSWDNGGAYSAHPMPFSQVHDTPDSSRESTGHPLYSAAEPPTGELPPASAPNQVASEALPKSRGRAGSMKQPLDLQIVVPASALPNHQPGSPSKSSAFTVGHHEVQMILCRSMPGSPSRALMPPSGRVQYEMHSTGQKTVPLNTEGVEARVDTELNQSLCPAASIPYNRLNVVRTAPHLVESPLDPYSPSPNSRRMSRGVIPWSASGTATMPMPSSFQILEAVTELQSPMRATKSVGPLLSTQGRSRGKA